MEIVARTGVRLLSLPIMRMYLSSFKLGNQPEEFQRLVGPVRRVAIIMNALDNFPDRRALWLDGQIRALSDLGFSVTELDLRLHFQRSIDLPKLISGINESGSTAAIRSFCVVR
jgi:dipeptidase E